MEIIMNEVKTVTEAHYRLLLEADPSRRSIDSYLPRSDVFAAAADDEPVGIAVLLATRPETLEIVNVAVKEELRGNGIATRMLRHVIEAAKKKSAKTLEIGTGSIGFEQLYLYQKCGFRMVSIDQDFFVRHYPEPIIENGMVLRDMVRLSMDL